MKMYKNVAMMAIGTSIGEAFTMQMDNLVIPYILYLVLEHLEEIKGLSGIHNLYSIV
jgi:hypothetical protein